MSRLLVRPMILVIESQLRARPKHVSGSGPPRMRWRTKEPNGGSSPRATDIAKVSRKRTTLASSPYRATTL